MRTTAISIFPDPSPLFSGLPWGTRPCGPSRRHWASWPKRRPGPCWPRRREGVPGKCLPTPLLRHPWDPLLLCPLMSPCHFSLRANVAPLAPPAKMGSIILYAPASQESDNTGVTHVGSGCTYLLLSSLSLHLVPGLMLAEVVALKPLCCVSAVSLLGSISPLLTSYHAAQMSVSRFCLPSCLSWVVVSNC